MTQPLSCSVYEALYNPHRQKIDQISTIYDHFWLLNQAYLLHKLERSNENFNHVTFSCEGFSLQNNSLTLISIKKITVFDL